MQVSNYQEIKATGLAFRDSTIKVLLQGSSEDRDNFGLYLQEMVEGFYTPRHRHNFDQFRIPFKNSYNIGPKNDLEVGQFAYFPEGVHYGPQHGMSGSVVLSLHFASASGAGYLNLADVQLGQSRLKDLGTFHDGIFTDVTPSGAKRNRDSYEAIWEHVNGRELKYPLPRYSEPIKVNSANFNWVPREHGTRAKHLGSFTENGAGLGLLQIDDGAKASVGDAHHRLLFCVQDGLVSYSGTEYGQFSAFLVGKNETCEFVGKGRVTLIQFTLPRVP
jgi:hypothetical protein